MKIQVLLQSQHSKDCTAAVLCIKAASTSNPIAPSNKNEMP
jgi:hypothetical protein